MASLKEIADLFNDKLNEKLGLQESQTLDDKLGLKEGQTLDDKLNEKLGLQEGQTLDDKLNEKLGLQEGQTLDDKFGLAQHGSVNMPKIERQVGILSSTSPAAAICDLGVQIVGGHGTPGMNAIRKGAPSTWTFIKMVDSNKQNHWMAVGAAHCAFPFSLVNENGRAFVQLPDELTKLATRVGICKGCTDPNRQVFPEHQDVVVVELSGLPPGVDPTKIPLCGPLELH